MDWNRRYEEGDTPWDKGEAHPVLRDLPARGALAGRILVPGCGAGHDVRALARQGLAVTGLDIAPLALEQAWRHGCVAGETYVPGDFLRPPPGLRGSFDGIFEHTCFCAIDPARRADYVEAAASLLRPGGRLWAVFFVNPDHDGGGPPFGCPREELDSLFGGRFRLLEECAEIPTFPERSGRELLRLHERI
jgi:SAM-dependent methyltransferase